MDIETIDANKWSWTIPIDDYLLSHVYVSLLSNLTVV